MTSVCYLVQKETSFACLCAVHVEQMVLNKFSGVKYLEVNWTQFELVNVLAILRIKSAF